MLDSASFSSAASDQATGLRHLFLQRGPRVNAIVAVVGTSPAAAAYAMACASRANHEACLLIDTTHGEVAQAFNRSARYELCHVDSGQLRLEDVVIEARDQVHILPAARGFAALARAPERLARIARALRLRDARIVIAATEAQSDEALRLARGSDIGIACTVGREGRMAAYALMKRLAARGNVAGFRLMVPGGARAAEGACELAAVARELLDLPVGLGAELSESANLAATLGDWACTELQMNLTGR